MVLHKLSVHPDSVGGFPPLRRGVRGAPAEPGLVCGSTAADPAEFPARPRLLVMPCPPPLTPLRKGGKGIARSRRHSIKRNKNAGIETVP